MLDTIIDFIQNRIQYFSKAPLCNLNSNHALFIGDFCLPLCARCSGILIGILFATFIMLILFCQNKYVKKYFLFVLLIIPCLIDGILQYSLEFDYPYRLALSATLERYGDPVGTKALYNFFGEKNIEYSLEQAINQGMLTPYKYHPVIVSLNNEELEKYIDLTKKIGKALQGNKDSDYLKRLLIMRARLIASAVNKIGALKELLDNYLEDNNMLIYCGAVKYEDEEFDDGSSDKKQIKLVVDMLNNNLKIKALKFTSEEKTDERKSIIAAFKDNIIQALVAIKCLDEGMNIPAIRTAFILASSTNPKEYIQRRGRVLRKYPGKKYADIYDFITLPFPLEDAPHVSYEKMKYVNGLVKRELTRFLDFANLAMNTSECNSIFDNIKSTYDLDIINIDEEVDLYE